MARLARVVVAGVAHHVTQRGNRRQQTFFEEDDYRACLALLGKWCGRCGVEVWAYCLMPNHVHLIVVRVTPLLERVKDWREYLMEPLEAKQEELWRRHERTGRPLGEAAFLDRIEAVLGRSVRPAKRGPKGPKPK